MAERNAEIPQFTGHCILDGSIIDVFDEHRQIPIIGGDITRALFKHIAAAMMQFLGRPPYTRIVRGSNPPRAEGPLVVESEAATKFLEYRMLCYVGGTDPRLEAFRKQLRQEVLEALDANPQKSAIQAPDAISPLQPPT